MTVHPVISEDELLRMSLTGSAPASTADTFAAAKAAGNACFSNGDYSGALEHYAIASAADPSSAIPLSNSAMAQLRLNLPVAAAESASTALALLAAHPNRPGTLELSVKTLLRRSTARVQLDMHALAAHDLLEILELQPGHEEATRKLRDLRAQHPGINSDGLSVSNRASDPNRAPPRIEELDETGDAEVALEAPTGRGSLHANGHGTGQVSVAYAPEPSTSTPIGTFPGPPRPLHTRSDALRSIMERVSTTTPRDGAAFEAAWRTLRGQPHLRARYAAVTVGVASLQNGLLGETLTAGMVEEFAAALLVGVQADVALARPAIEFLQALVGLPRFDLTIMFMSTAEKDAVRKLSDVASVHGVAVGDLRASYGL
jgi:tetratricopeptide (TPR) repeat protein